MFNAISNQPTASVPMHRLPDEAGNDVVSLKVDQYRHHLQDPWRPQGREKLLSKQEQQSLRAQWVQSFADLMATPKIERTLKMYFDSGILPRITSAQLWSMENPSALKEPARFDLVQRDTYTWNQPCFDHLKTPEGGEALASVLQTRFCTTARCTDGTPTYMIDAVAPKYLENVLKKDTLKEVDIIQADKSSPRFGIRIYDCNRLLEYLRTDSVVDRWVESGRLPRDPDLDIHDALVFVPLVGINVMPPI